jgi:hypothetical protein
VVELKYRARLGRRKVGGSVDGAIRASSRDRRIVLLSMLKDCEDSSAVMYTNA